MFHGNTKFSNGNVNMSIIRILKLDSIKPNRMSDSTTLLLKRYISNFPYAWLILFSASRFQWQGYWNVAILWRETNRSLIRQSRIHRKWPNAKVLWLLYEIQVKWNFKKLIKIGSRFRVWISDYSYERPNPFLVMWTSMRFVLPQMIKMSDKHTHISNLYEIPLCFTG